jgi:hypothetical protein
VLPFLRHLVSEMSDVRYLVRIRPNCLVSFQRWATSRHAADPHSITSLACASSDGGTLRLSALVVLTLITNSNLAGR